MPEDIETKVAVLERDSMHITAALKEHAKRTDKSLGEIKEEVSKMVSLQSEIVGINRLLSEFIKKHDKLEENFNRKLDDLSSRVAPLETFLSNTKFTLLIIKHLDKIGVTAGVIAAIAYFMPK